MVVDRLLERLYIDNDNQYPESIAFTLWGTDNIKTYGESLAQVLMLVGVRPVPDALGRVNKLEVIPLEELGRPRIDVVVSCSTKGGAVNANAVNASAANATCGGAEGDAVHAEGTSNPR